MEGNYEEMQDRAQFSGNEGCEGEEKLSSMFDDSAVESSIEIKNDDRSGLDLR